MSTCDTRGRSAISRKLLPDIFVSGGGVDERGQSFVNMVRWRFSMI